MRNPAPSASATTPPAPAPLYCIGDSHVSFFSGCDAIQPPWPARSADKLPWFRTFHVGPALAFNLNRPNTTTRGREKLFEILGQAVPPGSNVLLCFGEIDCRAHILKQAARRGLPVNQVVQECLDAYFQMVQEVQTRGFKMVVYNAAPSRSHTPRKNRDDDYVAIGSWQERNAAVRLFNVGAKQRSQECGAKFLENYFDLVNAGDKTEPWFFFDAIHVSQRAMPLTLRALAKLYPDAGYPELPLPQPTWKEKMWDRIRKRMRRWLKLT
jgi:hypothetical protein